MLFHDIKAAIEGLLYVVGEEGLTLEQLAEVLELDKESVLAVLDEFKMELETEGRGLELKEIGGAFLLATKASLDSFMKRLAYHPARQTLTQASLETLAIIAYKQPITRVEVEEIRGVKSEKAIQTLIVKQLIKETGRAQGTGRAILYGTTKDFLDYFGLRDLSELPPLPELDAGDSMEEADLFFKHFEENFPSNE